MKNTKKKLGIHSETRLEYIEVSPNICLHVRDWGEGRPIVLIPGWPFSDEMYDYQMTELAEKGFRAISISLRGFGESDKPWGVYNYDVYADDLKNIFEQLDLANVTLCGHSMGGAIAIRYMSRNRGDHVSKLALFGAAAPLWTKREDYPHGINKADVDLLIMGIHQDRPKLLSDIGKKFGLSEATLNPGLWSWLQNIGMKASPYASAQSLIALRDTDLRSEMSSISVPTAIFHSVDDKICPFVFAEEMSKKIKKSKIIHFQNSGHALFVEEKEKFNYELINFVSEG
ncbi:MAG: alpha/beta hydrolase [Oligoflexia bacterium]|nr:alpha/beta hydrolase [Oligoflexia bacterium]